MNANRLPCACGCGVEVRQEGSRGPARQYATAACRKRAQRDREALLQLDLEPFGGAVKVASVPVSTAPAELQVTRAVLEARTVAFALIRLGTVARPEIAWRCTKAGQAMVAALEESFGKEVTK